MILDTSYLIELLRGRDKSAETRARELDDKFVEKATTSISVMELWRGVQSINNQKEKKKVEELLQSLLIYSFNEKEAKVSGELEAELLSNGEIIDIEDIMIAGIAKAHGEIILTRNIKHFQKIKGLKFESY